MKLENEEEVARLLSLINNNKDRLRILTNQLDRIQRLGDTISVELITKNLYASTSNKVFLDVLPIDTISFYTLAIQQTKDTIEGLTQELSVL